MILGYRHEDLLPSSQNSDISREHTAVLKLDGVLLKSFNFAIVLQLNFSVNNKLTRADIFTVIMSMPALCFTQHDIVSPK